MKNTVQSGSGYQSIGVFSFVTSVPNQKAATRHTYIHKTASARIAVAFAACLSVLCYCTPGPDITHLCNQNSLPPCRPYYYDATSLLPTPYTTPTAKKGPSSRPPPAPSAPKFRRPGARARRRRGRVMVLVLLAAAVVVVAGGAAPAAGRRRGGSAGGSPSVVVGGGCGRLGDEEMDGGCGPPHTTRRPATAKTSPDKDKANHK